MSAKINDSHYDEGDNSSVADSTTPKKEERRRRYYSSNRQQSFICNAITGVAYPWKVGSYGESYLWKVVNCTKFEPKLYFYDSPEQYEEYRRVRISPEAKFEWHRLQQRLEIA